MAVSDTARQDALRFAEKEGGPFPTEGVQIPPLLGLAELLNAALHVTADEASDEELKLLLAPGSSLGGARPKASIIDKGGQFAIAKFPHHGDLVPVSLWEATALTLAAKGGIPTPTWRIEKVAGCDVLLLRRLDREGEGRIPFHSAMSMLDALDNDLHSYLEIADALRQHGAQPGEDSPQLWRRVMFNVLISNSDDHLRNHGFLYVEGGWRLASAYDLNPVPLDIKPRILTAAIDQDDGAASVELALETAAHYGLESTQARTIMRQVDTAVSQWRKTACAIGLSKMTSNACPRPSNTKTCPKLFQPQDRAKR